jgi:outer membrane murein-binding lipoprotein Lpp
MIVATPTPLNNLTLIVTTAVTVGSLILAYLGYRGKKQVDHWTVDLSAIDSSVEALKSALDWSEKQRTLFETRVATSDATVTSLHMRMTAMESELASERRAREMDQRTCNERLNELAKRVVALGGNVTGIEGLEGL